MNFLKKLFAKKPPETAEVPPEFLQEPSPDWLIDLKGQQPPDGHAFSIRVQLFNEARSGAAEIVILPRDQSGQPRTAAVTLDRVESDRLFVILGFSFPNEITTVPAETSTGIPITLTIYRDQPFFLAAAECNLDGWLESKKHAPPAVDISRLLFEIKNRALPS